VRSYPARAQPRAGFLWSHQETFDGRISTAPPCPTAGICEARRTAASSLSASNSRKPATAPVVAGPGQATAAPSRSRAAAAQPATIDGAPGVVFAPGGRVFAVFAFVVENDGIVEIDLNSDPDRIAGLRIAF
jgi:hypothetical protein